MQTIALACIGIVALQSIIMMSTLWYMASTGTKPSWLPKSLVGAQAANRSQP
jgi:hypothetical protein